MGQRAAGGVQPGGFFGLVDLRPVDGPPKDRLDLEAWPNFQLVDGSVPSNGLDLCGPPVILFPSPARPCASKQRVVHTPTVICGLWLR